MLIAILLVGATLRSPIASVGPLVPYLKSSLGMSNIEIGFMNTLPLLAFGLFSPLVPKISAKLGIEVTLLFSMFILSFGVISRIYGGPLLMLSGTLIIGIAISAGNVLSPGLIKSSFQKNIGFIIGLYSIAMNLISALSSGITASIASSMQFDWKFAMQVWSIFPILAILVFCLRLPHLRKKEILTFSELSTADSYSVWKSKFAWIITLFMVLQSLVPYSLFAWLPQILETKGFSSTQSGWYMSIFQFGMLPINFFIPIVTSKLRKQSFLTLFSGVFLGVGLIGLLIFNNNWIILFLLMIGIGSGATYSLAMMFFVLKTNSVSKSSNLSGMAQSLGYILAASGPLLLGSITEHTGNWNTSILILILVSIFISIFGYISGKDIKV